MNCFTFVQMVSWWWGCQSCVETNVLSSCLAVPSLCRPWTTCGILAQIVVVPQLQSSSSPSPPPWAPSGPAGALRPAMTTTASQAPASTSYTCEVDLLFLRTLTVTVRLAPPMGCRWNLACRLPRLPRLLSSHRTSRHLAAFCTPLLSSTLTLLRSEETTGMVLFVEIIDRCQFLHQAQRTQDKKCIYLTLWQRMDLLPVLGGSLSVWPLSLNWDTWTFCPLWKCYHYFQVLIIC